MVRKIVLSSVPLHYPNNPQASPYHTLMLEDTRTTNNIMIHMVYRLMEMVLAAVFVNARCSE